MNEKLPLHISGIPDSEYDASFLQGMLDRMGVSFQKYGPLAVGFPDQYDAISSLRDRLKKYVETGNTEWLMDVANFAMIEFMRPRRENAHFRATDSDESPGRVNRDTGMRDRNANRPEDAPKEPRPGSFANPIISSDKVQDGREMKGS